MLLHASCIPEKVLDGKGMTLCKHSDHNYSPGSPMLKPPLPSL